jgi:branched-chain amino acid transport system permease protein
MSDFFTRQVLYAIVSLSLLGAAYFGIERLTNSPYGRLLRSVREDELASQGIGKETYRAKRNVMALGSAMSGVAGVLLIFYLGTVQPSQFTLSLTGLIFTMVLLGGIGNNRGVLAGTIALTGSDVGFTVLEGSPIAAYVPFPMGYIHQILVGVLLIMIFAVRVEGLFPEKRVNTPAWRLLKSERNEPA